MINLIKLVSGEEIIADMKNNEDCDGKVIIDSPLRVVPVPTGVDSVGVQLMPFSFFTKSESIIIDERHIMFHEEPSQELKEEYCRATGKIITPGSGILLS